MAGRIQSCGGVGHPVNEWRDYLRENEEASNAWNALRPPTPPFERFLMRVRREDMTTEEQRLYAFHEQPLNRDRWTA